MTKLVVFKDGEHFIGFECVGHSGYAQHGEDIVCAAVSALTMHTLNALTDVVGIQVGFEVAEAYLECILPSDLSDEDAKSAKVLMDALYLSLDNLQKQYETYITITELEV